MVKEVASTYNQRQNWLTLFSSKHSLIYEMNASYPDTPKTLCSLHASAALSYYSALQGGGNGLFFFFISAQK